MFDFTDKSVAVVGSSGHLLERNYASLIDSHDVVIRFNHAKTEGYEDYVGSKVTHRVVNQHVFDGTTPKDRFPNADHNFVPKLKNQHILLIRPFGNTSIYKKRSPNNEVAILSDKNWNEYRKILGNKKDPSVGFIGVMVAISTSTNVNVFGFDQTNEPNLTKRHYWEDIKYHFRGHDYNPEKEVFRLLVEQNKIKIYS
jgi:hypothetical protein